MLRWRGGVKSDHSREKCRRGESAPPNQRAIRARRRKSKRKAAAIENNRSATISPESTLRLVIPHVGILRFVAQLRWKFGVPGVDVTSIARQKRVITVVEDRERPGNDLEET